MRGPKGEDLAVNDGHRVSRSVHGAASPTSRSRIYGRAILRALPPVMSLSKPGGEETEAISPHMSEDTIIILLLLLCTLVSLLGFASVASCGRGGSAVSESESDVDDRSATRGMKQEALQALPALLYCPTTVLPRAGVDCPICLTDFVEGEKIRMLPKCGHGFHVDCIDTWLLSNSSCPICRHCLLDVCEKAPMVSVPRDSRSQALSTSEQAASTSQSASNRGPVELQRTKDDHSIKLTNLQQPRN